MEDEFAEDIEDIAVTSEVFEDVVPGKQVLDVSRDNIADKFVIPEVLFALSFKRHSVHVKKAYIFQ